MGLLRWLLCILLAMTLLHPALCLRYAHALADGDLVELEDGDLVGFQDADDGPSMDDSPGQPVAMNMTMERFIETYNAACREDERVREPADRAESVFGVIYLAVGDKPGLYAQLALDPSSEKVLIAGAKLDASDDGPDLSGFYSATAAVASAAFPDLSAERRESLLGQTIDQGEQPGAGGALLCDGVYVVHYVVYGDGERAILMYQTEE